MPGISGGPVRRGISIKLIDWTTLTIFVIGAFLMFGMRSTMFPIYSAVLIWSCFALAAWSSVLVAIRSQRPTPAKMLRPNSGSIRVFIRLNLLMTLVWCGLMTVNIGFAVIGVIVGGNLAKPLLSFGVPTALLVLGFVFNGRFPARYLPDPVFRSPPQARPPRS